MELPRQSWARSPVRLVLIIGASLVVAEAAVRRLPRFPAPWEQVLVEAVLLTVVTAAVLYALVFRPLARRNEDLARLQKALGQKNALVELLQDISAIANEGLGAEDAIRRILQRVCLHMGAPVGHVYVADPDGEGLLPTRIWYLADADRFEPFRVTTEQTVFARGTGLIGLVLETGKPQWVEDVSEDPGFVRREAARATGLRTVVAFPILEDSRVSGALELCSPERLERDPPLLEAMRHIGVRLGRVIERERGERRLRESEERYRSLFTEARDAIGLSRPGGEIVAANPAMLDLFGYAAGEIIGLDVRQFYCDPADRERLLAEVHARGGVKEFAARMRRKDGREIDCLLTVSSHRDEEGREIGHQAVIHDVTERNRLEAQARQSQKMEAVGQLAGGVAHDFNNLLTIILGRTTLLETDAPPGAPGRRHLELIRGAATRAATLTRQLLAFSRKQVLDRKVVELDTIVTGFVAMLRRLIGEEIDLQLAPGAAGSRVHVDPAQIEQVILNLAINARDAMPEGGRLRIETANVEIDEALARQHAGLSAGPYLMLAVSDTGIGMDPERQARIFEPFFTTKEAGKGTGLGLSTVYGIVQQHGGAITVESEPGRGSTFRAYLPRTEEVAGTAEGPAADPGAARGVETVLLVEDDAGVRELACEVLETHGYTVLEAMGPAVALQISEEHEGPIHLLLTDLVMPHMSGRDLADRLLAGRPSMRVLHMSGWTDEATRRHGLEGPGGQLIQKPFSPEALARAVRRVLDVGSA